MTTFVGVDLAWGSRAASGVTTIDNRGRVVDIRTAHTDDEIVAYIRPRLGRSCVVAFDAPLVVRNAAGARACERDVNRYFGQYHAGCHPSNLGLPAFRDGGRAARIAGALRLDVDSLSTAPHRAIEVYPHPAIVMLFGLDSILKYKNRPGRALASLRAELLRLMSLMEGRPDLGDLDSPLWRDLRREAEAATTKGRLKAVEDRVDAVLCACIARYAHTRPGSVRRLGGGDGCIIIPVTPQMAARIDADADS